ncbi:O-antigen ligase family protein [Candidatus Nomurabacteria bacterium]|nr:O-antigen ligase family protein [Candidatus Kaiserbacteria bacterium]MCB9815086.1 O-antigen ligase family protein [Candidatus Nomurabacteria bacterium]
MKDVLKAVVFIGLFAVPFLTLYVENDYFFPFITGKNFWFRIIVDVVFAAWIILALYEVKYRPKISGIVWSFGILLVIMFFANWFGLNPRSSFWSNFERMDGYVSLVHTFMYMLVLGSVLSTKEHWQKLLNTSLFVAFAVAFYGLAQYGGLVDGSSRIDSRLGNAAYMAVYMLFHVFIAFWLFVETKNTTHRVLYGALVALFAFVLIETGTRGTAVGLAVGIMVMAAYIGLFGRQFANYRKYAIGAFALVILLGGSLFVARDSDFVQSKTSLKRIANISLDDLQIRGIIWGMAWEGVKERPILGYGQSNFNYVFNENFDPRLYAQEQWFDRSHNIFMDWLVTGGFLGLITYLSIFGWCVYYILVRPILKKDDDTFNVMERGVLLGILAGYFTHNLVVFDNIVSYIFFAIILALVNSRVGIIPERIAKFKVDQSIISQFAAPVVAALLIAGIYVYHVPGMQAAGDIIDAFRSSDANSRLEAFKIALSRDSFAHQEITEQLSQQTISVARDTKIPEDIRQQYLQLTEEQLMKLVEEKPGDARVHVFIGSYYRATAQLDNAAEQMAIARDLSSNKQSIIIQQAFIALSQNKNQEASDFFKTAFELDERNLEAREYYVASLFYVNEFDKAKALMDSDKTKARFAKSDFIISAANEAGQLDFVRELYEFRSQAEPDGSQSWRTDSQTWASLAFLYYQAGDIEKAIEVLNNSKEAVPAFANTASCFIGNLESGKDPQEGCN